MPLARAKPGEDRGRRLASEPPLGSDGLRSARRGAARARARAGAAASISVTCEPGVEQGDRDALPHRARADDRRGAQARAALPRRHPGGQLAGLALGEERVAQRL